MADIHEHDIHHEHQANYMGFLMGIILMFIILLFAFYFLPLTRGQATQLNIPRTIDINLHQGK